MSRAHALVDLGAIRNNFIRASGGAPAIAVIKADAYGHGAGAVAGALRGLPLAFAVATLSEANELPSCETPVIILGDGYQPEFNEAIERGYIVSIGTIENAKLLSNEAGDREALAVLAVNTGMNRVGIDYRAIDDIVSCFSLRGVKIVGIYSHPARLCDKSFTDLQRARLAELRDALKRRGIEVPISFESSEYAGERAFIQRIGISLYGFPHETGAECIYTPSMTIRAAVLSTRTVEKGDFVGYESYFKADRTMKIATIGLGYADGVPRNYGEGGTFLINGKRARVIGAVNMDMTTVVVDGIDCVAGDLATYLGRDGDDEITCSEIAKISGKIPYEITTSLGKRVERIYREAAI